MDYGKYKGRLIDFLQSYGIPAQRGLIRCFSPNHNDKNPSCQIQDEHFICHSGNCGIHGDIYDAVEVLEGITDKKEQYIFLEKLFGGSYTPPPRYKTEPENNIFTPDPAACQKLENYMAKFSQIPQLVQEFLSLRAASISQGKINSYPDEITRQAVNFFMYWPGIATARADGLTSQLLSSSGIPQEKRDTGLSSWSHSGLVLALAQGYKLHYYQDGICEKRGSKSCQTFPMPEKITHSEIILVEGELDAVMCRCAGLQNVYATGGTNGLTAPKIKTHQLEENVTSIIILFDNDDAGKKASGLIPYTNQDKQKTSLPERLRKAGYTGIIKIAQLENYKDPDEAILYGQIHLVHKAIEQATLWQPNQDEPAAQQKKTSTKKSPITHGNLTTKEAAAILKKLPITSIEATDQQIIISAMINALPLDLELEVKEILREWGATEKQLKKNHIVEPYRLVTMARKYNLSYYFVSKLEKATITKDELNKQTGVGECPIVEINFNLLDGTKDLKTFIYKRGEKSAAGLLERVLAGKLIYIESEKKYYFFNGLVWRREPDISGIAYNLLHTIIQHYVATTKADDQTRIKALSSALTKIEEYRYLSTVMRALAEKRSIFRDQISFDGPQIAETLTLQDGVIDFSGNKIRYRNATPEEYRKKILPYTVDQVRENKSPQRFLKFMQGNFRNQDTLETLMYYLSLIPSRRAQFKVGGIFVGTAHTGKTTTMKIISEIYPEMTTPIPREMIMSQGRFSSGNGPNPYMARLEGAGAGISDETKRNDTLNGALWKQLTGGGMLTARGMYSMPRDFMPTAQILILTNYSPKFDGKDQATIDRMVVVPFTIQHKKGDPGTMEENDLLDYLRPEFPLVVRHFAQYYINLKTKHKSKIPLSKECEGYKADYVENQETDLDRFVSNNIEFIKDESCWVRLKDVYARFCLFHQIELDANGKPLDKDAWSQSKFTRYLKADYNEIRIKQRKINDYPEQIVLNMRLKDWDTTQPTVEITTQIQPPQNTQPDQDDNPWD